MARLLEKKAKEAFIDDDFNLAVNLYSQAIYSDPNNADLFADRAQAYIKLNNLPEAVSDANKAIELNPSMAKAYLRKGIAFVKLEEYLTAKAALEIGSSLAQNDSRITKLIKECDDHIADESDGTHSCNRTAVTKEEVTRQSSVSHTNEATSNRPKYRHEYYQKPDEVVMTIFAKGIPAKNVVVDFGEQILSVTIAVPGGGDYQYQSRLFGKIIPDKCGYEVLSTKVEIRLVKAEAIDWRSLEYSKDTPPKVNMSMSTTINLLPIDTCSDGSQRPAYPSSKPTRDWDKLEAQVKKEEKEEKLDGDAALNKLFRDIYQNADEDMRRAMSKSFVESNGTVLSTDWKEVGSKKVEGSPPDGMELKKWEY